MLYPGVIVLVCVSIRVCICEQFNSCLPFVFKSFSHSVQRLE